MNKESLRFVCGTPAPPFPISNPHDLTHSWFIFEEAYWYFIDTGLRTAYLNDHKIFVKYKTWSECCFTLVRSFIDSEDPARFWKSTLSAFGKHKLKMPVSFALIVDPQGKVLLVKTITKTTLWSLPGGKCNVNQGESMLDCLVREIQEELGWTPKDYEIEDNLIVTEGRLFHIYKLRLVSSKHPTPDKREIISMEWMTVSQIKSNEVSSLVPLAMRKFLQQQ